MAALYLIRHHGRPRYIGSTSRGPSTRLSEHRSRAKHSPACPLHRAIHADPDGWAVQTLRRLPDETSRAELEEAEREAIRCCPSPLLNIRGVGVRRSARLRDQIGG